MFGALEWGYVLALLSACLIALILVLVARREAKAVRVQAQEDARELREHIKDRSAELAERQEQLRNSEKELISERRRLRKQRQRNDQREQELVHDRIAFEAERERTVQEAARRLEEVAGMTVVDARKTLERSILEAAHRNVAGVVTSIEQQARDTAEEKARQIIVSTLQRIAVPVSSAAAVTTLHLPHEEMRGRIIGKEGRNIRAFEAISGVDVLIEDDSSVVMLASFDPERRETATAAMEELLNDGRINPHRIEEALERAAMATAARSSEAGLEAAKQADVHHLANEIIEIMGQLRLRTSYGQSVLAHSVEVAQIAAGIAKDVGADPAVASRAGFLHDIGKAFTGTVTGTHAIVGSEFLAKHGELEDIVSAVAAHHDEVPHESIESVIVQIADAISAARPGARRDETTQLIERMERLEHIALGIEGVHRALAMSAGRELRVVVEPSAVTDDQIAALATDVARRIEREMGRLGVVTVTVVRELRAVATTGEMHETYELDDSDDVHEDTEPRPRT
ncbi:ribonucrease Y [Micrococcales bacterium KH10]|nr:ribonucrease Y [Micrococcales bacterium KH10]